MSQRIDDVTVVGGGDSGCLAALAINRMNPDVDVSIVDDFDAPLPQVGKATFLEIMGILHNSLGINEYRFIEEVKPVWKLTVYFRDWCGYDSFHYPFDPGQKFPGEHVPNAIERYVYWYEEGYANDDHLTIGEEIATQQKSPFYLDGKSGEYERYPNVAYHLNTKRFNGFLREICRERGISLVNDQIVDVEVDNNRIVRLRSESQSYESDLYIDATGFNRFLKGEQNGEFRDFPIPLDAAYTTTVDRPLSEVVPATVVDSGDHGWYWHIDTYENRDLGYVYSTDYVSDERAKTEFLDHWEADIDPDDVLRYEFNSGYYDPCWETNCVPIGNSAAFMEPLQAPALTTNAKAAVKLGSLLSAHGRIVNDSVREAFNAWMRKSWNSIYDFISIHYRYAQGDNEFWQALQSVDLRDRVEFLIEEFDESGFNRGIDPTQKRTDVQGLEIFNHMSFYVMMRNFGATSEFYETANFDIPEEFTAEQKEIDRQTSEHVDGFLTTEEIYRTVIEAN